MAYKWIEVTVKLVGEDYKESVEVYNQRLNFEYFKQGKPSMVAEIAAIVNDLPMPKYEVPMSPQEIDIAFDKEYSLYKDRQDNP